MYAKICSMFKQMKDFQVDGEYAEEAVKKFLKWQQEFKPGTEKPITRLFEILRKQQSAASIAPVAKGYCGFEKGYLLNRKNGLFN